MGKILNKIVDIVDTVSDVLSKLGTIGKAILIAVCVVYLATSLPIVVDRVFNGGKTPIVQVQKVDTPTIQEVTGRDERTSEQAFTEIQKAEPVVVLSPTASKEEVQRAIDELDGDYVLSEPSTKPGSHIYSIRVRRALYGIGLYADTDKEFGLHYRNKRWIYQIGRDRDGDTTGRITYELIQW